MVIVSRIGMDELNVVIMINVKILLGIEINVFIKWLMVLLVCWWLIVVNRVIKVLVV